VIVGPHESLARSRVDASGRLYVGVGRAAAKLRYRSPAVGAGVAERTGGFTLSLDEPAYGVARGQAAVLYEGDAVVGCGLISSAVSN
jgi:tRNA-uridine 2-sulfurtransferase